MKKTSLLENTLIEMVRSDERIMKALVRVRKLNLPQGCVAAGFIRNLVWDIKHGYENRTPPNDVDVLYYNPTVITKEIDRKYESQLKEMDPTLEWQVKNQARMHLKHHDTPYQSVEDAMKHWAETATAVGVRLENNEELTVIAPFGLDDLFGLILRCGPFVADKDAFQRRCNEKRWLEKWPKLKMMGHKCP